MTVITTNDCQCREQYERLNDPSERDEFNALSTRPAGRLRGARPKSTTSGSVPRTSGLPGELAKTKAALEVVGKAHPPAAARTWPGYTGPSPARRSLPLTARWWNHPRHEVVADIIDIFRIHTWTDRLICRPLAVQITRHHEIAARSWVPRLVLCQVPAVTVRASIAEVPGELDQRLVPGQGPLWRIKSSIRVPPTSMLADIRSTPMIFLHNCDASVRTIRDE